MLLQILVLVISATSAPQQPTFAGVMLGETVQQLVIERGDPLSTSNQGGVAEYVYFTPTGNSIEFVGVERGNVASVEVRPSPVGDQLTKGDDPSALGVHFGDTAKELLAIGKDRFISAGSAGDGTFRGDDGLEYTFGMTAAKVTTILARLPKDRLDVLPAYTSAPTLHGGASYADALVVKAANEDVGVRSEYAYIMMHPCAGGRWKTTHQTLDKHDGVFYDKLSAQCDAGKGNRDFYFNISDYFGKY
ncbi:MAG TPA: hypothetical protein VIG51_06395 [Candidatus Baltobacteraceae bacterium]